MKTTRTYILSYIFIIVILNNSFAQYDTRSLIASGIKLVQEKEYAQALLKFNKAIYVKPYLFEPYFFRGYTKFVLGDYYGAESDFNDALNINPYHAETYRFRGITRGRLKDYNRAFLDFAEGIKLDTFNVYLYLNRAGLYQKINEYELALADCNRAVKIKPGISDVYLNRGNAYYLMEEYKKALEDFDQAIKLKPSDDLAYIKKGLVYYQQEKYKKAIAEYDIAAKINPDLTIIYFYRALAKSSNLDYTEAMEDYNKVLELDPVNALTYYNLAILKTHVGAFDEAIRDYNQILQLKPNHILSLYNRAGLYMENEKYYQAIIDYTRAIELFPDFPGAYINRSSAKQKIGDKDGAVEDYNTGRSILEKYRNEEAANIFNEYADTSQYFKRMIELDTEFEYYNRFSKPGIHDKFYDIDILPMYKLMLNQNLLSVKPLENNYNFYLNKITKSNGSDTLYTLTNIYGFDYQIDNPEKNYQFQNQSLDALYQAVVHQEKQNYNSAKTFFNESIKHDTLMAAAWFGRACLEMEIDEFLQQFEMSSTMINLGTGQLQKETQERQEGPDLLLAKHDLRKTIQLNPDFAIAYYNLGNLNCILGEFDEAIKNYSSAIDQVDNFTEAIYNRGLVKIYLQKTNDGCRDLSKAGELGVKDAYRVIKKFCQKD